MINRAVNYTDMIGILSLSIPNADNKEDFNSISLMIQNEVSRQILGDELFNAFTTDFDSGSGTPTEQKWLDFLNGVTWVDVDENDSDNNVTHNLTGIKEAWKYFIYYEYLNQLPFVSSFVGKSVHNTTNSTPLNRQSLNIETQNRYNRGVELYKELIAFLTYYKEYQVTYDFISEAGGTYTVQLTDTTYIKVGDKLTIDGIDYTVTAYSTNDRIEFVAPVGLLFTNDYVTWYPFEKVALGKKEPIYFNGMI